MSNSSDYEAPPEQLEMTSTVDLEELPPNFPPPLPPEDEWKPIPKSASEDGPPVSYSLYGIIPVILGIFSLLLLMLCGFFAYQYFQSIQATESKMKSFIEWINYFQSKAETFQVQNVVNQSTDILERTQSQNEHLNETMRELQAREGHVYGCPPNHWLQYRDHWYHQTVEMVSWLKCSDLCISLNATFLESDRNMWKSIRKLLTGNHTWLGLSYKEEDNQWKWGDGCSPGPDLGLPAPSVDVQGHCAYLDKQMIGTKNCTTPSSCLCEKSAYTTNSDC